MLDLITINTIFQQCWCHIYTSLSFGSRFLPLWLLSVFSLSSRLSKSPQLTWSHLLPVLMVMGVHGRKTNDSWVTVIYNEFVKTKHQSRFFYINSSSNGFHESHLLYERHCICFLKSLCTVILVVLIFNVLLWQWEHIYDKSIKNKAIYFLMISGFYLPRFQRRQWSTAQESINLVLLNLSMNKNRRETRFCQCHQEEQSAWLKVKFKHFGAKNHNHIPFIAKWLTFSFSFKLPLWAQTEQHCSSKEGGERWWMCKNKKSLSISNDRLNKNISNRQTQSPQQKTRFCHGHNNQRKKTFYLFFLKCIK